MNRPIGASMTRREVFGRIGGGFGALGLAGAFGDAGLLGSRAGASEGGAPADPLAPKPPHFPARAKRVIFLFMNGGPSHVDTFDPKPALKQYDGKEPPASMVDRQAEAQGRPHGLAVRVPAATARAGSRSASSSPRSAGCIDDLCVIRSMYTDNPNHEPSLLMMNSGNMQPIRPSLGSWLTFGLGTENQNLPGFVVLCPGKPVVGPQLWSNSFLPGVYQGTHINNKTIDPDAIIRDIRNRHLSPAAQREQLDLLQELNRAHLEDRGRDEPLEARIASLEMAFRMQFEAREAFDLGREIAGHARALRRGRVRQRLPDRPPAGRARRPHHPGLLRQRPALGRPQGHHQAPRPRPEERPPRSPPC